MSFLNDRVLDLGLNVLDIESTRLDILSAEAITYAEATATFTLGNKVGVSVGAPAPGSQRKVTVAAITDGTVTATGTPTHWAITDVANSRLLACEELAPPPQVVTNGNVFTLSAFEIELGGPL